MKNLKQHQGIMMWHHVMLNLYKFLQLPTI